MRTFGFTPVFYSSERISRILVEERGRELVSIVDKGGGGGGGGGGILPPCPTQIQSYSHSSMQYTPTYRRERGRSVRVKERCEGREEGACSVKEGA